MRWVYLSPHFDDVVLSCAGIIFDQVAAGETVEAWTVCAGAPSEDAPLSDFALKLHERWQTGVGAVAVRRAEDEAALRLLGVVGRYWELPDCIYRRLPGPDGAPEAGGWLVSGEDDLWQPVHPQEQATADRLVAWLVEELTPADCLISPLTLGDHVDHSIVRAAAERAVGLAGCALWYYPDYPYAVRPAVQIADKTGPGWQPECREISGAGLRAWQAAIACYESQMSTFWPGRAEMEASIEAYSRQGGTCLWRTPAR